ncbi:universal stress protein [Dictyobacter kobayashii]|uniref:Universal stress protein UspA n=1 Tax=Dictyobacter kobayashii TaxID=2014872 RepID=A0A402AMX7_9CHLR|nr:universal stress protein [Dictyobacter kobayashii]GCE20548.1 universal stress protein UspA [Dictyobacter kobayashii]
MFKRILLPLDGSHHAERAIPIALRLARTYNGTIILLRVVNPSWFSSTQSGFTQDLPAHARFEAEQYLVKLTKKAEFQNIQTEIRVPEGNEASTILVTAERQGADIVILNSHGYTGLSRWTMGSVAEKVTRYAEMPILLLRDQSALPIGPHPDPTQPLRVLVPLDGSEHALAALEPAAEFIYALGTPAYSTIHLVRVIDSVDILSAARLYLQTIATRIKQGEVAPFIEQQQIPVTWSIAVSRDAADSIIRVSENGEDAGNSGIFGGCDMIAMSTHGLTSHPLWALGSTTERVRAGTKLPLLIIRPPAISKRPEAHQYEPEVAISEAQ